jgi:hypothetical protein
MAARHGGVSGGAGVGWLTAALDRAEMLATSDVRWVLVDCGGRAWSIHGGMSTTTGGFMASMAARDCGVCCCCEGNHCGYSE